MNLTLGIQMPKVVLISPKGPLYRHRGGIFKKNLRYAPLTLTTLVSLIPADLGMEVALYDEGIEEIDLDLDADLVCMTVITGTANRAYELSAHFRNRGIPVVLGGPHITLAPDDAAPHADCIVTGYAEKSWPQLLRDFSQGQLGTRYDQAQDFSLTGLPFPRRDLLKKHSYLTTHTFEATRGCIHSCDFCVVPSAWGTKPFQKPVEEIIADIQQHRARKIIFLDLNLVADTDYAARFFEALISLRVRWFGLATTLLIKNKPLLDLAVRSGCAGLLMGFESMSPANLTLTGKRFNKPADYAEINEILHKNDITLMACFTFGMDDDDPDIFLKTARFAVEANIDLPRFAIVTPFPGTGLYQRLKKENRILTENWDLYDGQHVVFEPKQMTAQQLYDGHELAWKHTYSASSIAKRIAGSRTQIPVSILANMGYRFYANHLRSFYNCDWIIGQGQA
jgi:radical SAM superfamily enzyme YgiQ (UPF0313 family)